MGLKMHTVSTYYLKYDQLCLDIMLNNLSFFPNWQNYLYVFTARSNKIGGKQQQVIDQGTNVSQYGTLTFWNLPPPINVWCGNQLTIAQVVARQPYVRRQKVSGISGGNELGCCNSYITYYVLCIGRGRNQINNMQKWGECFKSNLS